MICAMKHGLVLGAAWTASAAAAVGLGFLAVSLVDASASLGPQPLVGAATSPAALPTSTPPVASSAEQATAGGTVYASCADGVPSLAGAPAGGWWVDDASRPGEVEFGDGAQKVGVTVSCASGSPSFVVEGPWADNRSSVPAAPTAPFGDDSRGRSGGGHGADYAPGDDSSGRGGGGHGSDG
jgi:hypothetical protein